MDRPAIDAARVRHEYIDNRRVMARRLSMRMAGHQQPGASNWRQAAVARRWVFDEKTGPSLPPIRVADYPSMPPYCGETGLWSGFRVRTLFGLAAAP